MSQAKPPPSPQSLAREAALAQALRDNLRRRKQGAKPSPAKPSDD